MEKAEMKPRRPRLKRPIPLPSLAGPDRSGRFTRSPRDAIVESVGTVGDRAVTGALLILLVFAAPCLYWTIGASAAAFSHPHRPILGRRAVPAARAGHLRVVGPISLVSGVSYRADHWAWSRRWPCSPCSRGAVWEVLPALRRILSLLADGLRGGGAVAFPIAGRGRGLGSKTSN